MYNLELVLNIIEDVLNLKRKSIDANARLIDIAGWDSLTHVMIIGEVEEKLNVNIPMEKAMEITTVEELIRIVSDYQ